MASARRSVVIAIAAAVVVAVVLLALSFRSGSGRPTYAEFRLDREDEIPGTLGFVLEPPPPDFRPSVSPERALEIAAGSAPRPQEVHEVLASVPSALLGDGETGDVAVWVLVARGICYFSSKGDLVSSARSAPTSGELPACTRKNLSAVLVDARSGEALAAIRGYDLSGRWEPSVAHG